MKVLMQEWSTNQGYQTSISKDRSQLDSTIKEIRDKDMGDVFEEPYEVEIPDDSIFADLILSRTVFLHPDELDAITY